MVFKSFAKSLKTSFDDESFESKLKAFDQLVPLADWETVFASSVWQQPVWQQPEGEQPAAQRTVGQQRLPIAYEALTWSDREDEHVQVPRTYRRELIQIGNFFDSLV